MRYVSPVADRLLVLAIFIADGAAFCFLYLVAMLLFAKQRRLALLDAALGFGPTLFRVRVLGTVVRVKLFPLGSYVAPYPPTYPGVDTTGAEQALGARVEAGELRGYDELGPPERIVYTSLTTVVALAIAVVALGPLEGPRLALADLGTVVRGIVGPFSTASAALSAALARLHTQGVASTAARYTAVMLACQVFTVQNLQFLSRDRTSENAKRATKIAALFFVLTIPVALMWLLACVVWVFR
ncbi:MAG: hypothetical protein WDN08_04720 [Rhizomicrobium sp.]